MSNYTDTLYTTVNSNNIILPTIAAIETIRLNYGN